MTENDQANASISGADVFATRKSLDMSRREFARALGYTGNKNTINKAILDVERGKRNFGRDVAQRFLALRQTAPLAMRDDSETDAS